MLYRSRDQFIARTLLSGLAFLMLAMVSVASADSQARKVNIVNDTGFNLTYFYATNGKAQSWGRDHLGDYMIPPGGDMVIDFDDGTGECMFDFKAVFEDDLELEQFNIDVCSIPSFRYYEQ